MIPPVANRFVAGESPATALDHVRQLNERNVGGILNLLGEHYHDRGPADADAAAYLELIDDIARSDLDACISVKPSQIGLDVEKPASLDPEGDRTSRTGQAPRGDGGVVRDPAGRDETSEGERENATDRESEASARATTAMDGEAVFRANVERIAERAAEEDVFVWLDMEDHTTVDATLDAYEALARRHGGGVGVCVQAYLKRTSEDLERLADLPGKVRLVKGAYEEPAEIAYREREAVDRKYREHLERMFREFDDGIAVGSHDPAMIDRAIELGEEYGTPYEIQMLMGVREDAQTDLARTREVWQYVPYGSAWPSYFYRRVAERKENLTFALRAIASG